MPRDWVAFAHSDQSLTDRHNLDFEKSLKLHSLELWYTSECKVQHWDHPNWSMVIIGLDVVRSGFMNEWVEDPIRAVQDLPDGWILIAVERTTQQYWCGRDSIGLSNAYWMNQTNGMCISSSLKMLNTYSNQRPKLAIENLAEYLSFRYNHAPKTLFKDRFSLIGGHFTIIRKNHIQEERWYRPNWYEIGQTIPTEKEAKLEIDHLLRRSLEPTLFSGKSMGVLLSGGLDSSAILYHAHELGYTLDSFTVTLDGQQSDESPFAGRIAHLYNSPNHLLRLSSDDFIESLRSNAQLFDLPLPTPAVDVQKQICQFAGQWVDELFSGDGGDEVFGGRSMPQIARQMRRSRLLHRLPPMTQHGVHKMVKKIGKEAWMASYNQYGLEEGIGGSQVFSPEQRVELLQDPAFIRPHIRSRILTTLYQEIDSDPINDILYVWQRGWMVEDSLQRLRMISPNIVFPMLNRELREYCARLPGNYKVRSKGLEFHSKWLLRLTMQGRMPKRLLSRPKRTLMPPLDRWLRVEGRSFVAQQITEMTRDLQHLFLPSRLHTLYREHTTGEHNHGLKLWTLILFHLWHKNHIQNH